MAAFWTSCCCAVVFFLIRALAGQDNYIIDCDTESDVVFLVDSSASIRELNPADNSSDNWQIIKDFIINITMKLPVEDKIRVGVLKFSNKVDNEDVIRLGDYSDRNELKYKINGLQFLGKGTNTSGAIWYINSNGSGMFGSDNDRPSVPNYALLITDGLSNRDPEKTLPYARQARLDHGVRFFTVGVTKYANVDELQEIASDPVSYYSFLSEDFRNLNVLLDNILTRMCPEAPPPRGPCKDTRADVTFLLDSSGSIQESNWETLKMFVLGVINSLDLSEDGTRIAVIRYSTKAQVVFSLDTYFGDSAKGHLSDMREAIMNMSYLNEKTNISGALKLMRRDVFSSEKGDRPGVRNIGILISDGKPTEDVNDTSVEAGLLKSEGVALFSIALTSDINELELQAIASRPLSVYYMNISRISDVKTLTSNLIWGVCVDQCGSEKSNDSSCVRDNSVYRCAAGEKPRWFKHSNHILLGHNYDRLENIISAKECKTLCYRDKKCRSVDYVRSYKQCAVSYIYKDQAKDSFVEEASADYYELSCNSDGEPATDNPVNSGRRNTVGYHSAGVLLFGTVIQMGLRWEHYPLN